MIYKSDKEFIENECKGCIYEKASTDICSITKQINGGYNCVWKKGKINMMRKFEFTGILKEASEGGPYRRLPERSTKKSMAYDIFSPIDFEVKPKETYMLKTGIKVKMQEDEGLILNVRSSMGKKHIMLANTNGWIDSDFYGNAVNDGEIGLLFYNYGEETWTVNAGDKVAQAMFINFLKTDDDAANGERTGGFGSTGK